MRIGVCNAVRVCISTQLCIAIYNAFYKQVCKKVWLEGSVSVWQCVACFLMFDQQYMQSALCAGGNIGNRNTHTGAGNSQSSSCASLSTEQGSVICNETGY